MALTKAQLREILSGAGADPEKVPEAVDKIIAGHTASIEALREERETYKEQAKNAEAVQKELDELKAKSDPEALAKLQKEYDDFKTNVEKERAHAEKEAAFKQVLKDIGIPERHYDKVCRCNDVDGLELEDGKIKGVKELAKSIKEDWKDFIETTSTSGATTPNPPANVGTTTMTKSEIMQIRSASERQAALKAYMEAHGKE